MRRYSLEFILSMQDVSLESLKNSMLEFGQDLEISQLPREQDSKAADFRIRILTEEPTAIFDTCAQFGRLKSIKIDEKNEK